MFIETQKGEIEKLRDSIRELNEKEAVLVDYVEGIKRKNEELRLK